MKLNLAIDAAKRAAAKEIIPFYHIPYARQDKRPVSWAYWCCKVIVEMIENRGATGVITYDFMLTKYKVF
jgi:phosphoribosylpyrophosphate synthetase